MNPDPREPAAAESYPTFWEPLPTQPTPPPEPDGDAYAAFVNLTEAGLRDDPTAPDGE